MDRIGETIAIVEAVLSKGREGFTETLCHKCGEHPSDDGQRWCRKCRREYQRQWARGRTALVRQLREENAQLQAENKELRDDLWMLYDVLMLKAPSEEI